MGGRINVGLTDFLSEEAFRLIDYHSGALSGGGLVDIPLGGGVNSSWCIYNSTNKRMETTKAGRYRVTFEGYMMGNATLAAGGSFLLSLATASASVGELSKSVNGSSVVTLFNSTFQYQQYLVEGSGSSGLSGDANIEATGTTTNWDARVIGSAEVVMAASDYVRFGWVANSLSTGLIAIRGKITIKPVKG